MGGLGCVTRTCLQTLDQIEKRPVCSIIIEVTQRYCGSIEPKNKHPAAPRPNISTPNAMFSDPYTSLQVTPVVEPPSYCSLCQTYHSPRAHSMSGTLIPVCSVCHLSRLTARHPAPRLYPRRRFIRYLSLVRLSSATVSVRGDMSARGHPKRFMAVLMLRLGKHGVL